MRLFILGDTHGNDKFVQYAVEKAYDLDCTHIVQIGDLGFLPHRPTTDDYSLNLDALSAQCQDLDIQFFWIDGNHDNIDLIPPHTPDNFLHIRNNVHYIPRGFVWEWGGMKFMGFGGAWSIYRDRYEWWEGEIPSAAEVQVAVQNGPVDVLFTHDVPDGVDITAQMYKIGKSFGRPYAEATRCRKIIREVAEAAAPQVIYHGHYHVRYRDRLLGDNFTATVHGLGADMSQYAQDAWTVLDTEHQNW